jgi:hypothetical protein
MIHPAIWFIDCLVQRYVCAAVFVPSLAGTPNVIRTHAGKLKGVIAHPRFIGIPTHRKPFSDANFDDCGDWAFNGHER